MKEVKFKAGDLVYCPTLSNEILTVTDNNTFWFKSSIGDKMWTSFTDTGKLKAIYNNPSIFPATQEWYDKLVCIYPKLEAPPKRKESKEIIKAMLKAGYDGVPCKTECGRDRYICTGIVEGEFFSFQYDSDEDSAYSSGIPYYPKTGQKIIDFVDGEVVLESEDE